MAVRLVIDAAVSLRAAAAAMAPFAALGWASGAMPCYSTVRSWILRIGLHALTRPLDKTQPWVWLVDHTVQIGSIKLLIILGCPMSQVPFGERALQMSDLSLVALVPMEKSNGVLVETELENAAHRFRVELAIWFREHGLVQTTIETLRADGLHVETLSKLEAAWGDGGQRASTVAVVEGLREYVRAYQPKEAGVKYVASTEILEWSFGKLKRIEGQQSQDGITSLSLALGVAVGHWDEGTIREALDAVPEKKVVNTVERLFGPTVQWLRRKFFSAKTA